MFVDKNYKLRLIRSFIYNFPSLISGSQLKCAWIVNIKQTANQSADILLCIRGSTSLSFECLCVYEIYIYKKEATGLLSTIFPKFLSS